MFNRCSGLRVKNVIDVHDLGGGYSHTDVADFLFYEGFPVMNDEFISKPWVQEIERIAFIQPMDSHKYWGGSN